MMILIGIGIAVCPLVFSSQNRPPQFSTTFTMICLVIGAGYIAWGIVLPKLPSFMIHSAVPLAVIPLSLVAVELIGRVTKLDFSNSSAQMQSFPIYYRQPTLPVGDVYFRRPGPDQWTGRVLTAELVRVGIEEQDAYDDEPEITVTYDQQGFRNPIDLDDWDMVVVGDAFTELGFLKDDDLFTAQLGNLLNLRVKNLGLSYTGPFSHNTFLSEYGLGNSTTDAILVFFEGNDWKDAEREFDWQQEFKSTGRRPVRTPTQKQTSFTWAAYQFAKSWFRKKATTRSSNAQLLLNKSTVDITLNYAPPARSELDAKTIEAVESALEDFSTVARAHDVRPWIAYMPCKRRVFHEHLRFSANCPGSIVNWTPTDLPGWIQSLADQNGIQFIDLTPDLVAATQRGVLVFNPIYDTHVNLAGSTVVAKCLAKVLSGRLAKESR